MILVTGANGNLGKTTIDFLIKKNPEVKLSGLVRDIKKGKDLSEKGIELRTGDYLDYSSLLSSFKGVDVLLFVSSSMLENRIQQHKNVINAAKGTGIKHVVYTSLVQADKLLSPLAPDHAETEKILKESGLTYTIFRNTFYAEYLPMFIGKADETGSWYFPGDQAKVNFALRSEMAEALANVLLSTGDHTNRTYEITSGTAYTLSEIAGFIGEAAGKKVSYFNVPVNTFKEQLINAGLPGEVVGMSVTVGETFANGALEYTDGSFEKLLGRKPVDTKDFLSRYINNKN